MVKLLELWAKLCLGNGELVACIDRLRRKQIMSPLFQLENANTHTSIQIWVEVQVFSKTTTSQYVT